MPTELSDADLGFGVAPVKELSDSDLGIAPPIPDPLKLKLDASQMLVDPITGLKRESGMEAPTGLVTALGNTPVGRAAISGAETVGGGIKDTAAWLADAYKASQGGQDPM